MSTFERDRYNWRETYFVLFDSAQRPSLETIQAALEALPANFQLENLRTDADGGFESVTLLAPDAYAALDVSYLEGEEVLEQGSDLAEELEAAGCEAPLKGKLKRLPACDARFDVLHFEEILGPGDEEEGEEEMVDPSALLMVLDTLVEMTDGVAVDPQAGCMM